MAVIYSWEELSVLLDYFCFFYTCHLRFRTVYLQHTSNCEWNNIKCNMHSFVKMWLILYAAYSVWLVCRIKRRIAKNCKVGRNLKQRPPTPLWAQRLKGVLHPWALFLKTLCIFSKNKVISDKVSYGSGQKCSKEFKNHSFTSVETIVVKLQWKMCENQYFPCFEP